MTLEELYKIIVNRKKYLPNDSYIASLFKNGNDRIIQKIGEEATEVVIAAKNEKKEIIVSEISDLLFHILILMSLKNITLNDILNELGKRQRKSSEPLGLG